MSDPATSAADIEQELFDEVLSRHLVALCLSYEPKDGSYPKRFTAYAGTLLALRSGIYYLTAGHILQEIEEKLLRNEDAFKIHAMLADTFSSHRVTDKPIPFALRSEDLIFYDRDGFDLGVIPLRPYYAQQLALNGAVAIRESNWQRDLEETFDAYRMLGLPHEFTYDVGIEEVSVSPTRIAVERLDSPPTGHETPYPRFVGKIDLGGSRLKDIVGMSGGPIFGFRFKPLTYSVVALQSAWLQSEQIVFGCPIAVLAAGLEEIKKQHDPA
jgi:hypothetical protein